MILGIGEILVDVFVSDNKKNVFPGGAPFNVISNSLSFKTDASFYGVVGNDEYGKLLVNFVNSKKLTNPLIKIDDRYDTTQALVTLKDGERNFRFVRNNGADFRLDINDLNNFNYKNVNIIHFGSLMLSEESGREFLRTAIKFYRNNYPDIKLSFDVNYRDDIFSSSKEAIDIYHEFIKQFDIIKLSNDEVETLTNQNDIDKGIKLLTNKDQYVYVTYGKEGSKLFINGNEYKSSSLLVKPVDTTGAGDAFYSYVLASMDQKDFNKLNKEEIENILFKANCVGALATLKKGAIDVVPSEVELNNFINERK